MTSEPLASLLEEYEAGLHAELQLLAELEALALRQRDTTLARDYDAFNREAETRERVTRGLLTIEAGLRPVRERLAARRDEASTLPHYGRVLARHQAAEALVTRILGMDRESLKVMTEAESARKLALAGIEHGEMTLAAYRRVLAPAVSSATLFNTRG